MIHHELKIRPQYFARVLDGSKTFEVRENDRGFQPGDTVLLKEYDVTTYTGRSLAFKIGYVLPIDAGKVVFSLLKPDRVVGEQRLESLAQIEKDHIELVIRSTATLARAADILGVDLSTLWRRRQQYGILGEPEQACDCAAPGILDPPPCPHGKKFGNNAE